MSVPVVTNPASTDVMIANPGHMPRFKYLDRENRDRWPVQVTGLYQQSTAITAAALSSVTADNWLNNGFIVTSGAPTNPVPTARDIVVSTNEQRVGLLKTGTTAAGGLEEFKVTYYNSSGVPQTLTPGAGVTQVGAPTDFVLQPGQQTEYYVRIDNSTPGAEAVTMWLDNSVTAPALPVLQPTTFWVPVQDADIFSAPAFALGRNVASDDVVFWRITNSGAVNATVQIQIPYNDVANRAPANVGVQLSGFRAFARAFGGNVTLASSTLVTTTFIDATSTTNVLTATAFVSGTLTALAATQPGVLIFSFTPFFVSLLNQKLYFQANFTVPAGVSMDFYGFEWDANGGRTFI